MAHIGEQRRAHIGSDLVYRPNYLSMAQPITFVKKKMYVIFEFSVAFRSKQQKRANRQTDRQTDRQTGCNQ